MFGKVCSLLWIFYLQLFRFYTPIQNQYIPLQRFAVLAPNMPGIQIWSPLIQKKKYCICITTLEEINIQSFYVFNLESMRTIWKVKTSWKVIFVNFWQLYIACYNLWHMQTTFHPFSHRQIAQRASISFEVMFSGSPPYKCVIHVHIMVAVLYIWAVNVTLKLWLSRH